MGKKRRVRSSVCWLVGNFSFIIFFSFFKQNLVWKVNLHAERRIPLTNHLQSMFSIGNQGQDSPWSLSGRLLHRLVGFGLQEAVIQLELNDPFFFYSQWKCLVHTAPPTSENEHQSCSCSGSSSYERLMSHGGCRFTRPLRQQWGQKKPEIMKYSVLCKVCRSHEAHRTHNDPGDPWWGRGPEGVLHRVLEGIRGGLRQLVWFTGSGSAAPWRWLHDMIWRWKVSRTVKTFHSSSSRGSVLMSEGPGAPSAASSEILWVGVWSSWRTDSKSIPDWGNNQLGVIGSQRSITEQSISDAKYL